MAGMSIRGISDKTLTQLKQRASIEGGSLNALVLRLLQGDEPAARRSKIQKYDDLDALAGTWSAKDAKAFAQSTAQFSEVDPSLWR